MLVEDVREAPFNATHIIHGTVEEVLDRVKHLFGEYHPLGYGTVVKMVHHIGTHTGSGPYEAIVSRSRSCD